MRQWNIVSLSKKSWGTSSQFEYCRTPMKTNEAPNECDWTFVLSFVEDYAIPVTHFGSLGGKSTWNQASVSSVAASILTISSVSLIRLHLDIGICTGPSNSISVDHTRVEEWGWQKKYFQVGRASLRHSKRHSDVWQCWDRLSKVRHPQAL